MENKTKRRKIMEDYVFFFFPETGMLSRTNTEQMCHFFSFPTG